MFCQIQKDHKNSDMSTPKALLKGDELFRAKKIQASRIITTLTVAFFLVAAIFQRFSLVDCPHGEK